MDISNYCADCKNYFLKNGSADVHAGIYTINNGVISNTDFLIDKQFFAIKGSKLNDGVYYNTLEGRGMLLDETFKGAIWDMSVPPAFLEFCESAEAYKAKYNELGLNFTGFQSESFGGYSYSLPAGAPEFMVQWLDRLNRSYRRWRRINIF